jgi:drug/metabolite transporter (DMT)-like permease
VNAPPRLPDYALLVALAAIWGGAFMLMKVAIGTVPPVTMTAARVGIGALILTGVALAKRRSLPRSAKIWGFAFASGLLGFALPFTLISWGEEKIDSGPAAILMAGMPLMTILLARFVVGDEPLPLNKIIGVVCGLIGLMVLIGPAELATLGGDSVREMAVVLASFCYAVNAIVAKRIAGQDPYATPAAILISGSALLVPASLILEKPWTLGPTPQAWLALLLLGALPTAVAILIMLALLRRQGAGFFAQNNFLVPLFGVFWGFLILSERPPPSSLAALAIILIGIAVSRGRPTSPRLVPLELPK